MEKVKKKLKNAEAFNSHVANSNHESIENVVIYTRI